MRIDALMRTHNAPAIIALMENISSSPASSIEPNVAWMNPTMKHPVAAPTKAITGMSTKSKSFEVFFRFVILLILNIQSY